MSLFQRYPSGVPAGLSQDFVSKEFDCPCGCPETLIHLTLVDRLQLMRVELGLPIQVNSGYRCGNYQKELKARGYETAKKVSTHERGMAADIQVRGMSGKELEHLARRCGFTCIGVAANWIHVDTRDGERRWTYEKR